MKKYQFGTAWADWAWDLVGNNKIILDSPQHNGPFDHSKDGEMLFFVYGRKNIEIGHWGDTLIQDDDGNLNVEKG